MEKPNVYVKKGVLFIGNVMGSMRKAVGCEEKEVCLLGMVVRRVKKIIVWLNKGKCIVRKGDNLMRNAVGALKK